MPTKVVLELSADLKKSDQKALENAVTLEQVITILERNKESLKGKSPLISLYSVVCDDYAVINQNPRRKKTSPVGVKVTVE